MRLGLPEEVGGEDGGKPRPEVQEGGVGEGGAGEEVQKLPQAFEQGLHPLDGPVEVGPVPPVEAVALPALGLRVSSARR